MQICKLHWDALRDAIKARGLWHLVAQSGQDALNSVARQLQGEDTKADFDPLMNANWAIMGQALKEGGLYLMGPDETGNPYCPLCEVDKHAGLAQDWIAGCCDAQLDHARELGLAPPPQ